MIRLAKEKEKKKIGAPKPTYTPIDASLNKTYIQPRGALKSNIVVSQEDLMPTQRQASQPLQVRGALSAIQPKAKPVENPFPNLLTVFDQVKAADTRFATPEKKPMFGPPVPEEVKVAQRQNAAQSSPLTNLGALAANLADKLVPGSFGNQPVKRPIEGLANIPDIPGITTANPVTNFIRGAGDTATLGLSSYLDRMGGNVDAAEGATQTGAGRAGQIAGGFVLPAGRLKAGASLISNIGRGAGAGALLGAGIEAGEMATGRNDQSLGQRALDVGLSVGLGGAGVAAFAGLGKLAQSVINKYRKPAAAPGPTLGLPVPRQRGNLNTAGSDQAITPEYTFKLPGSSPATLNRMDNVKQARGDLKVIDDEIRQLNSSYERAIVEEYNYLKQSLKERGGVQQGQLQTNADGAVVGRTGRISNNPLWYQEFYAANGKVPSNKELYQLAKNRVDNGFKDETGDMPSWKVQNSMDESMEALQSVRNHIHESLREMDPAINITNSPLKTQELAFATKNKPELPSVQRPIKEIVEATKPAAVTRPGFNDSKLQTNDPNVLKFGNTVRDSQQTPKALSDLLTENPLTGHRTSDRLNHEQATKLIEKGGIEATASKLLAKRTKLSPSEVTAAQMIAKHYSNLGGDENLQKSIEIISKTAREGREMGQAIQALSMWNKLDQEGALLLAERQLNRGVTDTSEWTKLTVAQAKPVQVAAKKIEEVQEARTLADQIVKMLANKPQGASLTDAEKALIKQFEQQVKQVNDTVKRFMKKKQSDQEKLIKEVSNIQPKDRTRDQVVSYLEAKAAKAQARINRSRYIGFADIDRGNIVIDLSIIGASKVAKGVVKASDFAEQMIREFGDQVKPYMNEAFVKATNIFRRENGIPSDAELNRVVTAAIKQNKLDDATANSLRAMASEIGFYLDNNLKKEAIQDLQLSMKSLGSSTLGEKTATLQTVSQLLSVPTFLRNALGNMGQIVLEKTNKMNAVPIDWAVSKLTGERTIKFRPLNQEKFWRNFAEGTVSGWKGVSPTGTLSSYDIHPNVFGEKNPLKYLTKTLGASLQGMDYAAYRMAYGDVVATYAEQIGKVQGLSRQQIKQQMPKLITQLDQRILDMADQAGLYATYQDETMLSAAAQGIKRGLNSLTDKPVRALVDKGVLPKWASTEGFGLGDVVLKYARTPANLVMRGIDYSPLGFMRGVYELAPLFINRGKFDQAKAVRALSRAITGTVGLTGIGYALADAGILTGAASSDADMRSIQEQSGQGAYKVNWSALGRYLTSGLDKDAAKHQKGDRMMDYAWAQPAAISLGMGVNANQIIKNQKPGDEKHGFDLAFQSIIGGLRTVLENLMVSGLSNVVDATTSLVKRSSGDGFANIVKGVPASFVPAVVGQARTSTDNLQRETFDENVFKTMMNLVKNKVPGLSKTLPVSYDSLGNQRKRIQGGDANTLGQYLNSFVNPTKLTTYSASPEAKLVLDVLNDSQDQTVLPRIGQKHLMVDDPITKENKRIDLTKEQFSRLQQRMGEMVAEELRKNDLYLSNQNHKIDKRVDRIKDILTKVGSKARNEIRVEMGYAKKK